MLHNIKIAFFGTPSICIPILEALKGAGMMPAVIVTGEDKPAGRGLTLTPPPVKLFAIENNIPVLQPKKLDNEFTLQLREHEIELSIVVAYGKIIPEEIIKLPKYGTLNVHYSLLPKYRGASPVEGALLHGDTETGVSIQKMVYKLDAGDVLKEVVVPIEEKENKIELLNRLNTIASEVLPETITKYIGGEITPLVQDESGVTLAKKIDKSEGELDLSDDPLTNWRKYRAFFGYPGTFIFLEKDGIKTRLKITLADFENGKFIIKKVIPEGKRETEFDAYVTQNM